MRRAVAPLLLALAIVSPLTAQSPARPGGAAREARRDGATLEAASGPTTRYTRLYVFGDSYSDIGAGYIDGNGPTAVFYHEGHPSTAVHRIVGMKLFEEIAAR
jgi:phospholipase/lecithinase/hemolysin